MNKTNRKRRLGGQPYRNPGFGPTAISKRVDGQHIVVAQRENDVNLKEANRMSKTVGIFGEVFLENG